jgi:deoxyribonuclease-1-like protein
MFRLLKFAAIVATGFGAWYFFTHFRVLGLESVKVQPRDPAQVASPIQNLLPAPAPVVKPAIRLGAANFGPLDSAKLGKQHVVGRIVQVLRQYDVIAIQGIQSRDQGSLVQLVEQTNAGGRHFDFAVAPQVGREVVKQYNAFVFNSDTVEIDRRTVAWIDNRSGQFEQPPLVAAFRAKGPSPGEAFTFTLVNVHTSTERTAEELASLAKVFRAVRDDGCNEDDIILLGTIGTDDEHLGPLGLLPNVTCAVTATPTTTRGTRLVDNILFDRRATCEYVYRSGVVDLMRQFNLTLREAVEVSEHLPVWAEFSVFEGGQVGHVATVQ